MKVLDDHGMGGRYKKCQPDDVIVTSVSPSSFAGRDSGMYAYGYLRSEMEPRVEEYSVDQLAGDIIRRPHYVPSHTYRVAYTSGTGWCQEGEMTRVSPCQKILKQIEQVMHPAINIGPGDVYVDGDRIGRTLRANFNYNHFTVTSPTI